MNAEARFFLRPCTKLDRCRFRRVASIRAGLESPGRFDSAKPALSGTTKKNPAKQVCYEKSFARHLHVDYWQFVLGAGAIPGNGGKLAVLGGTNVTCIAPGVITGDVGVSPGGAVPFTNTTGCTIARTVHVTDVAALRSHRLPQCVRGAQGQPAHAVYPDHLDCCLHGQCAATGPLPPGVYCFPAAVTFTDTTLTLDGATNPNGIWIFKVGAALTGSGFKVVMANGGQACNVFWAVDAAATWSTSTLPPLFQGNILAGDPINGSIAITGGALIGRALANVALTMTNTNVNGVCALLDQVKAGCKNDDDDKDDNDKDKDHKDHKGGKDHKDKDHKD